MAHDVISINMAKNQLLALKYFPETYVANGVYDQETVDAVKTLQQTEPKITLEEVSDGS